MPEPIRVAIIGGGLMGCTLANGLLRYPHIDWQIFERKSNFVERGATVGFRANGMKALAAMGLDHQGMYKRTGAVVSDGSRGMVAYGEHKGKTLVDLPAGHINVMRTRWLDELLATLPKERLHANKKLVSVIRSAASSQDLYVLAFEDGSSFTANAVIGCDGIHSSVRELVLEDHPESVAPVFGGYWDSRSSTTPEEAVKRFGTDLFDPLKTTEVALTGAGAFMLFCPSDDGSRLDVIVSAAAAPDYDRSAWKTTLDRKYLESTFQDWETSFRDAVIDCIVADGPGMGFSQWMSPPTPTYCREPGLCIAGDAAHSMLPFMGNGAAFAMEDAAVLSRLLGACRSSEDIWPALQAFDGAQRVRGEEVVETSRMAARFMTGQLGLDPDELATLHPDKWWTDIIATDVEGIVRDAVEQFLRLRTSC